MENVESVRQIEALKQRVRELEAVLENVEKITKSEEVKGYIKRAKRAKAVARLLDFTRGENAPSAAEFVQDRTNQKIAALFGKEEGIQNETQAEAFVQQVDSVLTQEKLREKTAIENYDWDSVFEYIKVNQGLAIWKYLGYEGDVFIPPEIHGFPVEEISDNTFRDCDFVKNVCISDNVMRIGKGAFCNSGLEKIELPSRLVDIGEEAFSRTKLRSICLPKGVQRVGKEAFSFCRELTRVTLSDAMPEIPERAFGECVRLSQITIGNGVENIGKKAFMGCVALDKIDIPANVTEIEKNAFFGCMRVHIRLTENTTRLYSDMFSSIFGNIHSKSIIYCRPGSAASAYANHLGIETRSFEEFDAVSPALQA